MSLLRFLAQLHGHLGWLAAAALLHPALLLSARRGRGVAFVATLATVSSVVFGSALYPSYRAAIKRPLFVLDGRIGWAFERKEHLAFAAASCALLGLVAVLLADRRPEQRERYLSLGRRSYAAAFVFALAVALIGTLVASVRGF